MTSLFLDPEVMISSSNPRARETGDPAGHRDRATKAIEMDSSKLLAIARDLAHSAQQWPGMRRPTRRVWNLMAASEAFEAWVIGWPPGGAIELHDHGGSSGAVVVAGGELVETVITEHRRGVLEMKKTVLPTSASVTFGTTHVHDIINVGTGPAVSVHVYAPRLTAMTYYEFNNGLLEAGATDRYQLGTAIP